MKKTDNYLHELEIQLEKTFQEINDLYKKQDKRSNNNNQTDYCKEIYRLHRFKEKLQLKITQERQK